jgi:hypothetical protein
MAAIRLFLTCWHSHCSITDIKLLLWNVTANNQRDIMSEIKPQELRAVGRYAIRWDYITEWYNSHASRGAVRSIQRNHKKEREQFVKDKADKPSVVNYTKHAIEDIDKPAIQNIEATKLRNVVKEGDDVLMKVQTVFPLTMLPTSITIDRHKLTIIERRFLKTEQMISVPLENIKNIQANLTFFSGSLTITSDNFINNTQTVSNLSRQEAIKVQKMIQGAMVAISEDIDLSKIEINELKERLEQIGGTHGAL